MQLETDAGYAFFLATQASVLIAHVSLPTMASARRLAFWHLPRFFDQRPIQLNTADFDALTFCSFPHRLTARVPAGIGFVVTVDEQPFLRIVEDV